MARILAVDDEEQILKLIQNALSKDGHQVDILSDPLKLTEVNIRLYQLIILDVMMPGKDGFSLCSDIREQADCPILFLTAKTQEADVIKGLYSGGDDYITKPFGIGELRARVTAHLRREGREKKNMFFMSGVQFNMTAKKAYAGEDEIPFTKSEYAISEYLALNHGQVFSREQIYEYIFGYDGEGDSSAVTEHIKNIRYKFSKVEAAPIETVWGIGYRWK